MKTLRAREEIKKNTWLGGGHAAARGIRFQTQNTSFNLHLHFPCLELSMKKTISVRGFCYSIQNRRKIYFPGLDCLFNLASEQIFLFSQFNSISIFSLSPHSLLGQISNEQHSGFVGLLVYSNWFILSGTIINHRLIWALQRHQLLVFRGVNPVHDKAK